MAQNPPKGTQRIIPYLAYRDAPAAIEFLCRAFGFTERFRYPMPDGHLTVDRRRRTKESARARSIFATATE